MKSILVFAIFIISCSKSADIDLTTQSESEANAIFTQIYTGYYQALLELHPQQKAWINKSSFDEWNDRSNAIIIRMVNINIEFMNKLKSNVNTAQLNTQNKTKLAHFKSDEQFIQFLNKYWFYLNFDNATHAFTDEFHQYLLTIPIRTEREVMNFIQLIVDTKRKVRSLDKNIEIRRNNQIKCDATIINPLISKLKREVEIIESSHPVLTYFIENSQFLDHEKQRKYIEDVKYHLEHTYKKYINRYISELSDYLNFIPDSESKIDLQTTLVEEMRPFIADSVNLNIEKEDQLLDIYKNGFIGFK